MNIYDRENNIGPTGKESEIKNMKKKGFTLVELLAVIAILAILVIVAMPNVLGMFNQAKSSTFVTEVQEYLNSASTKFMTEALKPGNQGKALEFTSKDATKTLDMSGAEKHYYIKMDRNGNVTDIVIFDDNFCYEAHTIKDTNGNGTIDEDERTAQTVASKTFDKIDKTSVKVDDVWERGSETKDDETYKCNGDVKAQ